MNNIEEKIREEMEKFIINSIQDMIDNENFLSLYEIDKYEFGQYKLSIYDYKETVRVYNKNINFYFLKKNKIEYKKTFLGIKYGPIKTHSNLTKIGEKIEDYYAARKHYQKIQDNKKVIDYLPEDLKKNIKRIQFFKKTIE